MKISQITVHHPRGHLIVCTCFCSLADVEKQIANAVDKEDKAFFRHKVMQLRDKEDKLRDEEDKLRDELRGKENILLQL